MCDFWTTGQDPAIAAGAATFVRANVLALFGMAWNQSAARYFAAQGIVTPASVRQSLLRSARVFDFRGDSGVVSWQQHHGAATVRRVAPNQPSGEHLQS